MENISDQNLIQNDTWYNGYVEFSLPPAARFWLLIVFEIPSLVCSVILLYYLIMDANSRKLLSNHVIIALLSIGLLSQLIDIPSYLNFIRLNYVWPQTPLSCILWWFGATGISNITNLMMAWISIERHILIFNDRWLLTKRKQFFIHYIPLLTIISYGFIFYIIILTIYPCENMYTYTEDWCLYPCYYNDNKLALYDTIVNSIIPIPIIIIFNLLLIIRVIKQKHNLHRRIQWRQCRRMIKQLLSISALFLLFNLPMTSLVLAHVCGLPNGAAGQFEYYAYYMYHFISLLLPFVCLKSLPDIRKKIKRSISIRLANNTIGIVL